MGFSNLEAVNSISGWGCVAIKMCFDKQINTLQTSKHYNIIGRVGWGPRFGGGQLCRELGTAKLLFMINEEPLTHYYVEVITLNLGNMDKRKDYIFWQNQN